MTTEQQTKLDRIKAACRKALELDEAATPGPWLSDSRYVWALTDSYTGSSKLDFENGHRRKVNSFSLSVDRHGLTSLDEVQANAAFIANARNGWPAAARALLDQIEKHEQCIANNARISYVHNYAEECLVLLINSIPEEALQ